MRRKTVFFCALCMFAAPLLFCQTPESPETAQSSEVAGTSEYIEKFNSIFSFRVLLSYNFLRFSEDERHDEVFLSNKPLSIGLGFSWKKFSAKFSVTLPFVYNKAFSKTESFDVQMQYFGDEFLADGFFKTYRGLRPSLDFPSGSEIDLSILFSGISAQYVFNHKKHSLRAAYSLTERQLKPAGSLLVGGNVFFSSIKSNDRTIEKYQNRRNFLLAGPNVGYSHSWGFSNSMFLNLSFTLGLNAGFERGTSRIFFSPSASPTLAVGYHSATWSCSFSAYGMFIPLKTSVLINDTLMACKASLTFVKRF